MNVHRRSLLQLSFAAVLSFPAAAQEEFHLGREWLVREYAPDGRHWDGVWTRRGHSFTFDAEWRDSLTGGIVQDVIEFRRVDQNSVVLYRHGNNGQYFGDLSPDGRLIVRGSASWYGPGYYWTARIVEH